MIKDVEILVAAHKDYWMPSDDVYLPIHVGAEGKPALKFVGDNTGDNISIKNSNYCELTGIYWYWKNKKANYVGLCHYRRYFSKNNLLKKDKKNLILGKNGYLSLLEKYDCIVPVKRNYYIETVRSHYEHAHQKKDLDTLKDVIDEFYPSYSDAFETVMNRKKLHLLNMFVMKWDLFDSYCTFMFDVLDKVESRIDVSNYSVQEARVFGYLSERLFNVWLESNHINYKEAPVVFLEKVNWVKKINSFLMRKVGLNK